MDPISTFIKNKYTVPPAALSAMNVSAEQTSRSAAVLSACESLACPPLYLVTVPHQPPATWREPGASYPSLDPDTSQSCHQVLGLCLIKVDTFLNIRNVSEEFIFILQMFTLQIVDKSTSYTFKIVN